MLYGTGDYRYELVEQWEKLPEGIAFETIGAITIDSQDNLFVITRGAHPVIVFDSEGNFSHSWGEGKGYFTKTHGIKVGPDGSVYCVDRGNHTVTKFTPDGQLLMTLGTKDQPSDSGYVFEHVYDEGAASITQAAPPFNCPADVALSASGEIYVADGYGNARIHKFSPDGTLLLSWGTLGHNPGQFIIPHGIYIDKQERVWVADKINHRIQIFTAQGEFLNEWPVRRPQRPIFDKEETTLYVTDLGGLSIFTPDGKLLTTISNKRQVDGKAATFFHSGTHAVDSKGNLFVGGRSPQGLRISMFARKM